MRILCADGMRWRLWIRSWGEVEDFAHRDVCNVNLICDFKERRES
jgi:hypothetical protein